MNILLLEDNPTVRTLIGKRLGRAGHEVDTVENGEQGFLRATAHQYDIIICDVLMPHWDGFQFCEAMNVTFPSLPIIVISGSEDPAVLNEKLRKYPNVRAFLPKPVDMARLEEIIATTQTGEQAGIRKMTRVVCTIGPASSNAETISRMMLAGMDVARLNFSHGSYEQHEQALGLIREAEEKWQRPVAVLMDLCGPKIRTGEMENGAVTLVAGQQVVIQAAPVLGTGERFSTIAPEILADLRPGEEILLDDGLLELKVEEAGGDEVVCRVVVGGTLKSHKGINLPGTNLSLPCLTDKDKADLAWSLGHSIDYVALSFVRSPEDIAELRGLIREHTDRDIKIVAKIEKPEAVQKIDAIIEATDAVMIARGDLGVEIPAAQVPWIQKNIIKKCWETNTPVITATQMLDTMTTNSRPTRAEVTDVSVAVREGTDAVMLSGETAAGVDPVNVVRTMASIICEAERHSVISYDIYEHLASNTDVNPAITAAASLGSAAAVLVLDFGNNLYRHLSKWNRRTPTILATNSIHAARHSCLYKNIIPFVVREKLRRDEMVFKVISEAKERGYLAAGDVLAVVEGERLTQGGIPQTGAFQLVRVD